MLMIIVAVIVIDMLSVGLRRRLLAMETRAQSRARDIWKS